LDLLAAAALTIEQMQNLPATARLIPLGMLALSAVSVPWMVLGPEGLTRRSSLRLELGTIHSDNSALLRDIGHLRAEVKALREDPASVERIARDQLGMVRRSEVVFQFSRKP
jgi:cell division protein FtsB